MMIIEQTFVNKKGVYKRVGDSSYPTIINYQQAHRPNSHIERLETLPV
jgi:hypothetical protein